MYTPPKPNWFCMNQSHKFHYFKIMKIVFMLIKNVKIKKNCESACKRENDSKYLLKMDFWWPKIMRKEDNLWTLKSFESQNFRAKG